MSAAMLTCVVLVTCLVPTIPPLVVYIPKVTGPTLVDKDNPKAKWTNLSAKGTFGGILVAAEHHKQKAAGTSTNVEQKVTLLHEHVLC
jgi:hypothetical protein